MSNIANQSNSKKMNKYILLSLLIMLFLNNYIIAEETFYGLNCWQCTNCGQGNDSIFSTCSKCKSEMAPLKLCLSINFKKNLLFSKYDLYFYIDGIKISSITHGESIRRIYRINSGKHTLKFEKTDDPSINIETSIIIDKDSSIKMKLQTSRNGINISEPEYGEFDHPYEVKFEKIIDGNSGW